MRSNMGNKVKCLYCGKELLTVAPLHLKTHGLTVATYRQLYPNAPIHSEIVKSIYIKVLKKSNVGKIGKTLEQIHGLEKANIMRTKMSERQKATPRSHDKVRITCRTPEFRTRMSALKKEQLKDLSIRRRHSESLRHSLLSGKVKIWNKGLTKETDVRVLNNVTKAGNTKGDGRFKGANNPLYGKTFIEIYGEQKANELKVLKRELGRKIFNSIRLRELRKSPDYIRNRMRAMTIKPNKPEIKLTKILNDTCYGHFKYNGDYSLGVSFDGLVPDYWNVNGQKKVIELFGDYWHSEKVQGHSKEVEEITTKQRYAKCGIDCLIIWEHELKEVDKLKNKIIQFTNNAKEVKS